MKNCQFNGQQAGSTYFFQITIKIAQLQKCNFASINAYIKNVWKQRLLITRWFIMKNSHWINHECSLKSVKNLN